MLKVQGDQVTVSVLLQAPSSGAAGPAAHVVGEVISAQMERILAGETLQQRHAAWASSHAQSSLRHAAAAADVDLLLDSSKASEAAAALLRHAGKVLGAQTALFGSLLHQGMVC